MNHHSFSDFVNIFLDHYYVAKISFLLAIIFESAGEIISGVLLFLILFICVIHGFRMFCIIKTNIKNWNGGSFEWISLAVVIGDKYYSQLYTTLWNKHRRFIYGIVKNKVGIWFLDSFLCFENVKSEWSEKKWKFVIFRGFIYFVSIFFQFIPILIYSIFFSLMIFGAAKDLIQDFIYPYHSSFNFQSLPFPIQQRFLHLQKPVTKFRFSKAFFKSSLKSTYNKICVDNLSIRRSKKCHMIYENFVRQQIVSNDIAQPSLTIGCNVDAECKCRESLLSNISVVNGIYANLLPQNAFSQTLSSIDLVNVKFVEIIQSELNFNDLEILSTMKLQSAYLNFHYDDTRVEKMKEILGAVKGVPHLRISITGECHSPDEFAVFLVEWVLENGYIKSFFCTGSFFGEVLTFKSSKELNITDILLGRIKG